MPYILTNTSGTTLTTVLDGTVNDNTTSLTFIGKNFSGYGQSFEQNFIGLLENFNNSTPPGNPLQGQLWFNYNTQQLRVCYDGENFKGLAAMKTSTLDNSMPSDGDFLWDELTLKAWNATDGVYVPIGPYSGYEPYAYWEFKKELDSTNNYSNTGTHNTIVGLLGGKNVAVISNDFYTPSNLSDIGSTATGAVNTFTYVQSGITLPGVVTSATTLLPSNSPANVLGSSIQSGFYFWGTAAESLASVAVELSTATNLINNALIPFAGNSQYTGGTQLVTSSTFTYNPGTGVVNATATAAFYADLAERYEADQTYDVGTVLVLGGFKEVTTTTKYGDVRVAGIVSKNPAYMMNSDAGTDETHPYIALKGRVPCKVYGTIAKGDLLVTSAHAGYAEAYTYENNPNAVIAKAIESNSDGFGVIEVMVI